MPDVAMRPDAVYIPSDWARGRGSVERSGSIVDFAAKFLLPDPLKGDRVSVRVQPGGRLFCTLSPYDTICFPTDHHRQGYPRYNWVPDPSGADFGYLIDEAKADVSAPTQANP